MIYLSLASTEALTGRASFKDAVQSGDLSMHMNLCSTHFFHVPRLTAVTHGKHLFYELIDMSIVRALVGIRN